jgi:1-acyl-sn-glycerol-3-phosphate acyltransferase
MAKPGTNQRLPMPDVSRPEHNLAVRTVASILIPLVRLSFKIRLRGAENLPKTGGYILAGNHCTELDGLALAYVVYKRLHRTPHFFAKGSLFTIPVIGKILLKAGQIPIYRGGRSNEEPLRAANLYLNAGQVVGIFPEGTLTREPNLWPMRGKFGAVKLALDNNVPLYVFGQFGTEKVMPQYTKRFRPGFWKPVDFVIGNEVNLDRFRNERAGAAEMLEATEMVMREITKLVEEIRGEKAPAELFDPAKHGIAETGNFKKNEKGKK